MNLLDSGTTGEELGRQTNLTKQTNMERKRRESGQSAVEMALMLPLLLLLIFGMLEMGWLATTRQTMDAITREATRAGTVAASTSAAITKAIRPISVSCLPARPTVTAPTGCTSTRPTCWPRCQT